MLGGINFLRNQRNVNESNYNRAPVKPSRHKAWFVLIIILFITMWIATGISELGQHSERKLKAEAITLVKLRLKSPSTAEFCSRNSMKITTQSNDDIIVRGYVNAQNSYGTPIRAFWSVRFIGGGIYNSEVSID